MSLSNNNSDVSNQDQDPDQEKEEEEEEEEQPEKEYECGNCQEMVTEEDCDKCISCEHYVCGNCSTKDYPIGDWYSVDSHCSKCDQIRCEDCVFFCYDCANKGDMPDVYCKNCCPDEIQGVHCGYHAWATCQKHRQENENQCGECYANRCYAERH